MLRRKLHKKGRKGREPVVQFYLERGNRHQVRAGESALRDINRGGFGWGGKKDAKL